MLIATLLLLAQGAPQTGSTVFNGRAGMLAVSPPRMEEHAVVDGILDEDAWRHAAILTGFSQYMPIDGVPASDSTEVLVWYAPDGIYFGIRAFESHGGVHATLADRDRIDADDYVQILLDTYNDRRRALVFSVNPLGVQADGIRSEGTIGAAGGQSTTGRFENVDMNPDYVFDSKGRVTESGYEVEIFIPFKSVRYQAVDPQSWGIHVIRKVQHSGYEESWAPARRANASFLAQAGTLEGLHGLHRGLVVDLNPFATGKADGSPTASGWDYDATPEVGVNARWGVTSNLTLDATVNPDFSQVEADVGVVTVNERFAVFYPEKRPFFLEGIEQFDTPNQLIYMRRIAEPLGGAKLTGKVGATNVGLVSVVDDKSYSASGTDYPIYNLLRVRHDLGDNSTVGISYTDKMDGGNFNRVAGLDAHLVFAKLYFLELQAVGAFTREDGATRFGPLWEVTADRTGRTWGFHYTLKGMDRDFDTQSGYVPRTGVVTPAIYNRLTFYGRPGSLIENSTTFFRLEGVWDYHGFFRAEAPLETVVAANSFLTLRGGWRPTFTPSWQTVAFDPAFYSDYYVATTTAGQPDTVPFVVPERVNDARAISVGIGTPQFQQFAADVNFQIGKEVAHFEPSRANALGVSASLTWRPTEQIRIEPRYAYQYLTRERDGSRLSTAHIPRIKIEYQVSRAIFLRFVGQYSAQERAPLRDPRTDETILRFDADAGAFAPAEETVSNDLRVDMLFSYRPTPGTVLFVGYGASLTESDAFRFSALERVQDGFFAKLSYLFRM